MSVILTALIVLALIVCWGQLRTIQLARTPFQHAAKRLRPSAAPDRAKVFDVFLSYKSEEAVLARHFAEQLVAHGVTPWFAEYTIAIADRARFQERIDLGIQASRFGLCLTDARYFHSKHCRHELTHMLLRHNCGAERVIEVKIDPDSPPAEVSFATSLVHTTVAKTLGEFGHVAGLDLDQVDDSNGDGATPRTFLSHERSYSLDLTGWEEVRRRPRAAGGGDMWGPAFKRWCGSDLLWGHVIIGPQDSRTRRKLLQAGAFDDREYYEEALRFADFYFKNQRRQRCVGVHLLFLDGWSHVALTTFCRATWSRMYSLVFPGTYGKPDTEFAFFFFCREPFDHFCRHAHLMDKLVMSLRRSAA